MLRWFKQASADSAGISGTLLKGRVLHTATRLDIGDFKATNGWMDCFNSNTFCTLLYQESEKEEALQQW